MKHKLKQTAVKIISITCACSMVANNSVYTYSLAADKTTEEVSSILNEDNKITKDTSVVNDVKETVEEPSSAVSDVKETVEEPSSAVSDVKETVEEPSSADADSAGNSAIAPTAEQIAAAVFDTQLTYGDFTYIIDSKTHEITLTDYNNDAAVEKVEVPSSIDGFPVTALDNTFSAYYDTIIKEIVLPDTITALGHGCFFGCTALETINIPSSDKSIGNSCFDHCISLKNIDLPDNIESLGNECFKSCSLLSSIDLSHTKLTVIPEYCFTECTSLENILLPDALNNIGKYAFSKCKALTSIIIPDSVISMGRFAFDTCSSLRSVTLSSSLTSIPQQCFSSCSSLEQISLPSGITALEYCAFDRCTALTEINMDNITVLDEGVFSGCTSLQSVTIPDSINVLPDYIFKKCTSLTSISIPDSVTEINEAFIGCSSLKDITLPETLTKLSRSFEDCTSLEYIHLPDSLTELGNSTFNGCSSLKEIEIPLSITSLSDSLFSKCSSLTKITHSVYVTDIGVACFSGCTSLREYAIPSGVNTIGRLAFSKCTALESITIPNTVTSLGESVFEDCTSLKNVNLSKKITNISGWAFQGCTSLEQIVIPDNILQIRGSAFGHCSSLKNITLSKNLNILNWKAFEYCSSLENIVLPDSLTRIEGYTFDHCTSLKNITFPSYVSYIGDRAFQECTALEDITLPNGLSKIGYRAFSRCKFLRSVVLPYGLQEIDMSAFEFCTSLRSVTFPSTFTKAASPIATTPTGIFYKCKTNKLTIYCPANSYAEKLAINSKIKYQNIEETIPDTQVTDFEIVKNDKDQTAYISKYIGAGGNVTIPANIDNYRLTSISDNAFFDTPGLKSVFIPRGITSIGNNAFSNCSSLKSVTFESGGSNIVLGKYAFYNCTSLKEISLPQTSGRIPTGEIDPFSGPVYKDVPSVIGSYCFMNCTSLKKADIAFNIDAIQDGAFKNCNILKIYCDINSSAYKYATDAAIPYILYAKSIYFTNQKRREVKSLEIAEGEEIQLLIDMYPSVATDTYVLESDDPSVASVSYDLSDASLKNGIVISGLRAGKSTGIMATTSHGEYNNCIVTVVNNTSDIVINRINNIKTVSLSRELYIKNARKLYDALSIEDKKLVTNYQLLINAENELAILKTADEVTTNIINIKALFDVENITFITKDMVLQKMNSSSRNELLQYVNNALKAYNNLSEEEQKEVSFYGNLIDIKNYIKDALQNDDNLTVSGLDWFVTYHLATLTSEGESYRELKEFLDSDTSNKYSIVSLYNIEATNTIDNAPYTRPVSDLSISLTTSDLGFAGFDNIYIVQKLNDGSFKIITPTIRNSVFGFNTSQVSSFAIVGASDANYNGFDDNPIPKPSPLPSENVSPEPFVDSLTVDNTPEQETQTGSEDNSRDEANRAALLSTANTSQEAVSDNAIDENKSTEEPSSEEEGINKENNFENRAAANVLGLSISNKMSLLSIFALLLTIISGLFVFYKKKTLDEDDQIKNKGMAKKTRLIITSLISLAAIVTFLLTEPLVMNFSLFDSFSIIMVLILIVQIAAVIFTAALKSDRNSDSDE